MIGAQCFKIPSENQVPKGFSNWIKRLELTEKELTPENSVGKYHVHLDDKNRYEYASRILTLLSNNDLFSAIDEYTKIVESRISSTFH